MTELHNHILAAPGGGVSPTGHRDTPSWPLPSVILVGQRSLTQ